MEPLKNQRFAQEETAERRMEDMEEGRATGKEERRADFQALIAGPYRQEFEEAVKRRVQYELERLQNGAREKDINARMKGEQANAQREAALRQHFARLTKQGEELKQTFPDFDLMREMQNPAFVRMTAPGTGVSVKDAFYAVHGEDIQRESMQYAAIQAGRRIAASVQAGASRPVENGIQAASPVMIGIDIRNMNKKQREEYRRRIQNGETINFRDKF
ncbi:MAG: hypothetical protein IKO52_06240 [Clostridia bacterium]|nr:hypothetical protein [Clostridia bacterium]